MERYDEALKIFLRISDFNPQNDRLLLTIASLYWRLENYDQASALLSEILDKSPDNVDALNELGLVKKLQSNHAGAIDLFQKALALDPKHKMANLNLAMTLQESGDAKAAAEHLDVYEQIHPSIETAVLNALIMPVILQSSDSIDYWRERLESRMSRASSMDQKVDNPLTQIGQDHFHLAYQARNDCDLQRAIADAYLKISPSIGWESPTVNSRLATKKIKVGFVSSNLRNHTVGHLNLGYIQNLDRNKFEVSIIAPAGPPYPFRKKIEFAADHVVTVPLNLDKARSIIADGNYDVLFFPDIGMGAFSYFLAFARLAPVQAVSWGHPVSTGIPNVDYFVSCDLMEPPDAEAAYSENLVKLPDTGGHFFKPETPLGKFNREQHDVSIDRPLIMCLQSCFKFHPDFDPILRAILEELPEASLVLLNGYHKLASDLLHKRLEQSLGQAANQIRFVGPLEHEDFLRLALEAKVILDIPQWSGGRSSYESLAMGTPIVHKPGEFMRGRHTLAFYKTIGVDDCIVETDEEYVNLVVKLVRDPDFNKSVREKIYTNVDKLFKRQSAVKALEDFFMEAVATVRS